MLGLFLAGCNVEIYLLYSISPLLSIVSLWDFPISDRSFRVFAKLSVTRFLFWSRSSFVLFFSSSEHFCSCEQSFWIISFFSLILASYFVSIALILVLTVSNSCLYLSSSLFTSVISLIHSYSIVSAVKTTCSRVFASIANVFS